MTRSSMSKWTVEEIVNDADSQCNGDGYYPEDDVESILDEIYDKVYDALSAIEDIQGIEPIEECKSKLNEVAKMF